MAITSVVGAEELKQEQSSEVSNVKYKFYFGVFFDGTNNNAISASTAKSFRSKHAANTNGTNFIDKGKRILGSHIGKGRHEYERGIDKHEADEIDNEKKYGVKREGDEMKGYSNVAILHSKYAGCDEETDGTKIIVYKIYVEGSGANDIKGKNGVPIVGLGMGLGKTGVVALVSKAVDSVDQIVSFYKDNDEIELHFDIFGFSRGAACARLFSFLVRRDYKTNVFNTPLAREKEFKKYYCKRLYKDKAKGEMLYFLDDFTYKVNESSEKNKTKIIDFLGIFDTVVSIGMLRREKMQESSAAIARDHESQSNTDGEDSSVLALGGNDTIKRATPPVPSLLLGVPSNDSDTIVGEAPEKQGGRTSVQKKEECKRKIGKKGKYEWWENDAKIEFKRTVPAFFSNVPLHLMATKAISVTKRKMFKYENNFYVIPNCLINYYKCICENWLTKSGRHFLYPGGKYNSEEYRELRLHYLHFTSEQKLGFSRIWNVQNRVKSYSTNISDEKVRNLISRIIYHGDKDDQKMHYMFDYGQSAASSSETQNSDSRKADGNQSGVVVTGDKAQGADREYFINPLSGAFLLHKDFSGNFHDLNVDEYGMYAPKEGGFPTFHICAMDEFRENFALTDIGREVPENCLELFLPGCHSDIGGGYLCNEEEKIVLNKYVPFSLDNIRKNMPGKTTGLPSCADMCIENPHDIVNLKSAELSISVMQDLGWLPKEGKNGYAKNV